MLQSWDPSVLSRTSVWGSPTLVLSTYLLPAPAWSPQQCGQWAHTRTRSHRWWRWHGTSLSTWSSSARWLSSATSPTEKTTHRAWSSLNKDCSGGESIVHGWDWLSPLPAPFSKLDEFPQIPKVILLNLLASTRYHILVFCRQSTFYAMKRSWGQDELWTTTSNLLVCFFFQAGIKQLDKGFYDSSSDETAYWPKTQVAYFKSLWLADWHKRGGRSRLMTLQHTRRLGTLHCEGDCRRSSLFGPLLLWQQQFETDAKSSWYKQSLSVHLL